MGFSWQEYWSGWPFSSPGDLPGIESESPESLSLLNWQGGSLPLAPSGRPFGNLLQGFLECFSVITHTVNPFKNTYNCV